MTVSGINSPAAMQVAQERGVFAFGQASDMKSFGPKAQLTSIMDNWGPYYIARTKAGQFAYVTVGTENVVKVFRTTDFVQVASIPVGALPHNPTWPWPKA